MVALPADSDKVYTPNMGSNTVSELDIATGKLLRKITTEQIPEAITINKEGNELWVGSNKEGFVSVYDLIENKRIKQWSGYGFPYRILLTEDQNFAVVPDFKKDTLDIIDVQTKRKVNTVSFDRKSVPKGVIFHPNDRTLFMSAYGKDKVIAVDITSGQKLFTLPTGDGPDGIGYSSIVLN